jgi:hypothetical protein
VFRWFGGSRPFGLAVDRHSHPRLYLLFRSIFAVSANQMCEDARKFQSGSLSDMKAGKSFDESFWAGLSPLRRTFFESAIELGELRGHHIHSEASV